MKNYLLFLFYFLSIIYLHCQVKVIDVEDPGSLSKLVGNEINTITDLKIKGKINTSDLNTLNSMRKLSVLDLSHSSITDGILPSQAFRNNTVLKNIILPSNLTTISKEAFEYAYNISVDASKCSQLNNIGEYAFNGVKGKVALPDHLESLPYKSFANFNGTVNIPKNLKTIGKEAFYNSSINTLDLAHCSQLKNIGEYAFNGVKGKVILPDHLESLPYKSFASFNGTVVLPKNLKTIGQGAFYYSKISTLDLTPCPLLETISKEAFEYAYNVSVDASKCSQLKNIGEYAFNGVKGKVILPDHLESLPYKSFAYFNGTVILPKNLKTIGQEAFYGSGINSLDLTHCYELKNIGDQAFNGAKGKVILPDHLESLPYKSFASFNGTVVLPKNLKVIDKEAFLYSGIKEIILPASLKKIDTEAFYGAKQLVSITSNSTTPPALGKNVFYGVDKNTCLLQVPNPSRPLYAKADQWKDFQFKDAVFKISLQLPESEISVNTPILVTTTLENKGNSNSESNWKVAYFLSEDDLWDANDTLLTKHSASKAIPAKDKYSFNTTLTFPNKLGDLYLIAVVIPKDSTDESSEDCIRLAVKVHLSPEYKASITSLDKTVYAKGEKIIFKGKAWLADQRPAADKNIRIYLLTAGTKREIITKTHSDGSFTYLFNPLSGESGYYQVGASHPDISSSVSQAEFNILGVNIRDNDSNLQGIVDHTVEGTIEVKNTTNLTLHNLKVIPKVSSEKYSISFEPWTTVEPQKVFLLTYKLTAKKVTEANKYEPLEFEVISDEGNLADFSAKYTATTAKGNLEVKEYSKEFTITKGKKRMVEYTLVNTGKGDTGKLSFSLPSVDWFRILNPASASIDNLAPGQTATFSIELSGKSDLPIHTPFKGTIAVNTEKANSVQIPLTIEMVSEETGSLWIDVVDEYSYNTPSKPHVKNAKVIISHPFTGKVLGEGITDENGLYKLDTIPEGYYTITVSADKHETYKNNIIINAGKVNKQKIFISYKGVSYTWDVTPTEIEDEYDIELKVDYETNVPQPVVVMDIPKPLPTLEPGATYNFMVTLSNKGLITAQNAKIHFDSYNNYVFTPLVNKIDIPALSAVQIPVVMSVKNSNSSGDSNHNHENTGGNGNNSDNGGSGNNGNGSNGNGNNSDNGGSENNGNESNDNGSNSGNGGSGNNGNNNIDGGCISFATVNYKYVCGGDTIQKTSYTVIYKKAGCGSSGSGSLYLPDGHGSGSGGFIPIHISNGCNPTPSCILDAANALVGCVPFVPNTFGCIWTLLTNQLDAEGIISCLIGYIRYGGYLSCGWSVYKLYSCLDSSKNAKQTFRAISVTNELNDIKAILNFLNTVRDFYAEYYGNSLINSQSLEEFAKKTVSHLATNKPFTSQEIEHIKSLFANSDLSSSDMDQFFTRWNLTVEAWNKQIFAPNDQYPDIVDKTKLNKHFNTLVSIKKYIISRGYDSLEKMYEDRLNEAKDLVNRKQNSVCAKVSLNFKQKMVMTREAFEGNFSLSNGNQEKAIKNIKLDLEIKDEQGNLANDLFQITINSLTNLTHIDGTGTLEPGKKGLATILFIPTQKAAPKVKKYYSFGGTLSYTNPFTDEVVTIKLFPNTLEVNPSPNIYLDYFMQRNILGDDPLTADIEPMVPAELGIIIHNKGVGTAKNVRVDSAQPQIVDNEKGLAIDFDIMGSSFNGKDRQLGLTYVDFGNIEGGKTAVAQWWITSSLLGHFIDYEAKVSHTNSYGNPDLSLVGGIKIHELIKSIRVYGDQDDGINDFLVNDIPDLREFPDSLFLSNGGTEPVFPTKNIIVKTNNSTSLITEIKITPSQAGWNYGLVNDPWNGNYSITKIVRNDGVEIPVDNFWLTHCTLHDGADPIYENKLHVIDKFESLQSATYTVFLEFNKNQAVQVEAITHVPDKTIYESLEYVDVTFNTPINPATFTYKDIYLSCQGGKNLSDSSISISALNDRTFRVSLKPKTKEFGYYRFRVLTTDIEDTNGNKGSMGKEASWTQIPQIKIVNVSGILNDGQPVDKVEIQFNIPVNFTKEAVYLVKGKSDKIILDDVTISNIKDNMFFTLEGLNQYNRKEGNYSLVIDLSKITDMNKNSGKDIHSQKWVIYPPTAQIKLYPNPVLYNLTLESNIPIKWYHIVSLFGKSEFYEIFPENTYKTIIKTNNSWNKGIYLIFIYDHNNKLIALRRFIKI